MRWSQSLLWLCAATTAVAQSTQGIYDLVQRRMPNHANSFQFTLTNTTQTAGSYDQYVVSTAADGTVTVQGSTLSALASGYAILQGQSLAMLIDYKSSSLSH